MNIKDIKNHIQELAGREIKDDENLLDNLLDSFSLVELINSLQIIKTDIDINKKIIELIGSGYLTFNQIEKWLKEE